MAGAAVANIYYVQPLLNSVGAAFGVSEAVAGLLVTCAQIGYVAGLALLVPLGDLVERRALIVRMLLLAAVASGVCAAAPALPVLGVALVALGVLSVVAQVVVALASTLAADEERGQVVGTVMSGLLGGILLARTVSGLIAEVGGWRAVFAVAAVGLVALALVLRRALPVVPRTSALPYPALLRSIVGLVREEPVLRQRMAIVACNMAAFSMLWTAIAFLLHDEPYGYSEGVIGLFGLVGVAGVAIAPVAGRLADRGHSRAVMTALLVLLPLSWGLNALGGTSLVALLAGIVLLDLALTGAQITNQSAIYALRADARSRLTTAYMTSSFAGGVCGSIAASVVQDAYGWGATCAVGAGLGIAALAVWTVTEPRLARTPVVDARDVRVEV
ncbi:MAG TPA: MFS transporter [Solirubrobacteraceae bacterium]|nr:MFS transporter [Solirubrobacteraceae bacterium]